MAAPDRFGTNLPANFKGLAGTRISDMSGATGGTFESMPAYLQELYTASQEPTVSAATAASPASSSSVAAPTAAPRFASLEWKGLAGREAIPSMKGNLKPTYQIPIEQLNEFMGSGYGSNYRTGGTFNEGESNAPRVNLAAYTDPYTGEVGKTLFFGDKDALGRYRNVQGGNYISPQEPGWNFNIPSYLAADTKATGEAATPTVDTSATSTQYQHPYVLSETPEEFRYAEGGLVEAANQVRDKGRMGDSILAHISPDEARMLKMMGGAGTINPETGLPEYFSFKKLLGAALPIVGNMITPGIGGILGGAAGGALSGGGIEGALMGAAGAGFGNLGGGLLGGSGSGGGLGFGNLLGGLFGGGDNSGKQVYNAPVGPTQGGGADGSFSGLAAGSSGGADWKKYITPAGLGLTLISDIVNDPEKKNRKFQQEQERARREKEDQESEEFKQMMNEQLKQSRTYNAPPADYYTYGSRPAHKYYSDYKPIGMAQGGYVGESGAGGGQDDTIQARLSNNEYVIPADVVAHLGDGAPKEGAAKLEAMIANIRKHKAVKGHPPKAKPVKHYVGGLAGGRN